MNELRAMRDEATTAKPVPKGLERYFPPCTRADCERHGKHSDVLPHQAEFVLATEKYLCGIGGFGSGKTVAAAVRGVLLSAQIKGNHGFVGRVTNPKLHDSTLPVFLDVLGRVGIEYEAKEIRDGFPHRVILPNASQIVFRETQDIGRFLGSEYGWFYLDEASEMPKLAFTGLQSRLRLPQASRYLTGFLTSNPPHHTHWIAEIFGAAPGVSQRGNSQYRLWKVPSSHNPYLPPEYIADLKANHSAAEVKRIVEGEYGFSFEGKAVYMPPFDFGRHVGEYPPLPQFDVLRSWDFGYRSPAVTWHQFERCHARSIHWRLVHEYKGAQLESEDLAMVVLEQSAMVFPGHAPRLPSDKPSFIDCGDHAGAQISEKGPGPIERLRKKYGLNIRHRNLPNIDPGLALVRDALRGKCPCGRPVVQIHRALRHTIDALAGGYHYPSPKWGKATTADEKPHKDGFYDDLADTIRYAGENYYRGLLKNPAIADELMADQIPMGRAPAVAPWAWMDRQ